jgi:phenylalanyl-tRNA synthetase beta chain
MRISYNWLQDYFEEKLPEPEKIEDGIIFHSFEVEETIKVGDDTIFDVKVLPDRNHDCLSHWGIAKEISAIFDLKIADKNLNKIGSKVTSLEIDITDEKCLRYMGRIIKNIKVGESPDWLKEKLNVIGQKSINNIVDIANFVMFDLGQPIHCFDLDKLASEKLIIRNGKVGEKIITLDKKEVNLDESILVIADEDGPLAIAGIKGGTKAEVDFNTKNIVIEVANFNPTTTRKTAKKINILTDAVKRYENEISPELCSLVMDEMTSFVFDLAGGEVEDVVDIYPKKVEEKSIKVTSEYINKRLGADFSNEEIESVWKKLNFSYTGQDGVYEIQVPYLRLDLIGPHDLTEEVIRILGYDRLPLKLPEIKNDKKVDGTFYKMLLARNKLLSDGYSEVMTYVFKDKGEVEVLASATGKNFLRNNLTDGLKESIKLNMLNLPLLNMKEVKIFEIGTVFLKGKEEIRVVYGDKKNITELSLEEFCEKSNLLSENIISFDNLIQKSQPKGAFKMWSIYPFIVRDIAVWVSVEIEENGVTNKEKLVKIYKEFGGEILNGEPILFDEFTKGDKTSVGYRLIFQSYVRTLTDDEVSSVMKKINEKISLLGWEVR